jgi:hypothetical protein
VPYRDGKPLADVIPPDRRKQKAIALVAAGALGGAFLVWMLQPPDTKAQSAMPAPVQTSDKPTHGPITQSEVNAFVASRREQLRTTCFLTRSEPDAAKVHLTIDISKNGDVTRSAYEGSDSRVTVCVDKEIRQWSFPAHDQSGSALDIAISFDRS